MTRTNQRKDEEKEKEKKNMSGTWSKMKKTLSFKGMGSRSRSKDNMQHSPLSSPTSSATSADNTSASSKKTCAICLGNVRTGQGQALFTAECSHSFHFSCIANNVKHGDYLCPICRSKWNEIPFQLPTSNIDSSNNAGRASVSPEYSQDQFSLLSPPRPELLLYSDDEPLPAVPPPAEVTSSNSLRSQNVIIKAFTEFPAVAASDSVSRFAVLVGIQAPLLLDDARNLERAPIDLVTVLDVSGSMAGSKLALLKRAVQFVIDNLGPYDRLAIVSFSSDAQRIFPLRRMTDRGRENAKRAVNSLSSYGGTNIVEGLNKGARVLEERRELNPVASIILLSDGRDTHNCDNTYQRHGSHHQTSSYLNLLPVSICSRNREAQHESQHSTFPVHTFGFGSDHDSSAMHAISDASGGTFSFIESVGMVQDAFARCIGGLLSVVAQELRLTVRSASPGIKIGSIPSGRYTSEISERGSLGVINVGDLYAEEEKEFLVYLSVPTFPVAEDDERVGQTSLLDITCSYKDAVSKDIVRVEGQRVEIRRPKVLSPTDVIVSLEVDRQRNRLWVAEGLAESQEMAEMGNLEGAQAVLTNRRSTLLSTASAQAGDGHCNWLEAELSETSERMASQELYERRGRAYVLSGLSSHDWQRATTRGDTMTHTTLRREGGSSSTSGAVGYHTPAMVSMVSKSQNLSLSQPPEQVERLNKTRSFTPRRE